MKKEKEYIFEFDGSKNDFCEQLKQYRMYDYYYFDDYIVDNRTETIKFGIRRESHSGGYWYIPEITEINGKLQFIGKIEYIGQTESKTEMFFLGLCLLPIIIVVKIILFIKWALTGFKKKEQSSQEDKLFDLMINHLNCRFISL